MKHQARVLQDAEAGSTVTVAVDGISSCQRCARGGGCGAGLFNQGGQAVHIQCHTSHAVRSEQTVLIEHDDGDSSWLWAVAGAYGLPTFGLLSACGLATVLLPGSPTPEAVRDLPAVRDWLIGLISLAGLAGGVIAWRRLAPSTMKRVQRGPCLQSARIVAVTQSSLQAPMQAAPSGGPASATPGVLQGDLPGGLASAPLPSRESRNEA